MEPTERQAEEPVDKRRVTVLAEPADPVTQPEDFHLCPLGLQFHTESPLEPFTILEVGIEAPDERGRNRKITCTGVVVRCQPDKASGRYRVWLQFLDLPAETRERLRCTAVAGKFLCSYCMNF
jgi:hypothetical protein